MWYYSNEDSSMNFISEGKDIVKVINFTSGGYGNYCQVFYKTNYLLSDLVFDENPERLLLRCYMKIKDYGWKIDSLQWNVKVKYVKTYLDLLRTQMYNNEEVDVSDEQTDTIQ